MKTIPIILILLISVPKIFSYPGQGSGTREDPYQVTNIHELQEYTKYKYSHFVLMNDIDASNTRNWNYYDHDEDPNTPDVAGGFQPGSYCGKFDGDGHIISNLYMYYPHEYHVALFSDLYGDSVQIYNLGVVDCDITGLSRVAGLCGDMSGSGSSIITNCFVTGQIRSTAKGFASSIAGFCATNRGRINNCYSNCKIITVSEDGGSIASFNYGFPVSYCYTTGQIISNDKSIPFGNGGPNKNIFCYFDYETTGIVPDAMDYKGAKGYSSEDMKKASTYGFDFENVWCIDEGNDYPKLRVFGDCPVTNVQNDLDDPPISFSVYPNPAINAIEIDLSSLKENIFDLEIINSIGIKVFDKQKIYMELINDKYHIDISIFPSGSYIVIIKTAESLLSKHIIISN